MHTPIQASLARPSSSVSFALGRIAHEFSPSECFEIRSACAAWPHVRLRADNVNALLSQRGHHHHEGRRE